MQSEYAFPLSTALLHILCLTRVPGTAGWCTPVDELQGVFLGFFLPGHLLLADVLKAT